LSRALRQLGTNDAGGDDGAGPYLMYATTGLGEVVGCLPGQISSPWVFDDDDEVWRW
jgi:hypothetical protein